MIFKFVLNNLAVCRFRKVMVKLTSIASRNKIFSSIIVVYLQKFPLGDAEWQYEGLMQDIFMYDRTLTNR